MKKIKRSLALVLSLILIVSMTACGKKEKENNSSTDNPETDKVTTAPKNDSDSDSKEEDTASDIDISEHVTLTWYLHGSDVSDDKAVLEKVNEYLKEKLNVTLKPIWGTWADFDDNVVLSINGGDKVDIYFTCSWSADEYNLYAKKGNFARLDDPADNLIEKYAKELWDAIPEVLHNGATIEGRSGKGVYGIPGYKDIALQNCWDVNVTLLEKYGYTIDDIINSNYYEFDNILQVVKEGEEANGGTFYPLLVEGAVLERMVNNTIIVTGDAAPNLLSYYLNPDDVSQVGAYGNTIFNKFATPEYEKFVKKTREYFLAGYIDPAMGIAGQANSVRSEKLNAAEYLICTQSYSLGYEVQVSATRGIEVAMVPTTEAYTDTTTSQGALMAVSINSSNKERAVMFLNLLNTDPYLFTLLEYGIEGVHYEMVNGGEVRFLDKRNDYKPWTNGMGNVTQLPPLEGQGLNFQEEFKSYYGNASKIPVLGWTLNQDNIQNELAALANVASEYSLALSTGTIDPETELPKFLKKLEDNGIQKVVDEANKQLSEFLSK